MNDRLSRNSLSLVGKVNRDEVVFLAVPVFVLDETLWNVFGYYRIPTKTPGILRMKMSTINLKKLAGISQLSIERNLEQEKPSSPSRRRN